MPLTNIGIRFSNGSIVGRWDLPNPTTHPERFKDFCDEIGFHIGFEISRGATGCFFVDMPTTEKD